MYRATRHGDNAVSPGRLELGYTYFQTTLTVCLDGDKKIFNIQRETDDGENKWFVVEAILTVGPKDP